MPPNEPKSDSSDDSKSERLQAENKIEMKAYDLSITLESEETSIDDLAKIASEEMDHLTKRALVGEFQELEEKDLHTLLFGGKR